MESSRSRTARTIAEESAVQRIETGCNGSRPVATVLRRAIDDDRRSARTTDDGRRRPSARPGSGERSQGRRRGEADRVRKAP
ncbi:hypothetical protein BRC68_10755 [Halobacteriales archaeon QH_6_64_20]|nr:MAG: hypothetical protein BRC68_10755 [Halobacteriales archaeon QH_6_64_20]